MPAGKPLSLIKIKILMSPKYLFIKNKVNIKADLHI
jgi:hypothetical protein